MSAMMNTPGVASLLVPFDVLLRMRRLTVEKKPHKNKSLNVAVNDCPVIALPASSLWCNDSAIPLETAFKTRWKKRVEWNMLNTI